MFGLYPGSVADCGSYSPSGFEHTAPFMPSDSSSVRTIVIGRPPDKVKIDVSNIVIHVVPAGMGVHEVNGKTPRRRRAAVK